VAGANVVLISSFNSEGWKKLQEKPFDIEVMRFADCCVGGEYPGGHILRRGHAYSPSWILLILFSVGAAALLLP
jgi:hypothetical protein